MLDILIGALVLVPAALILYRVFTKPAGCGCGESSCSDCAACKLHKAHTASRQEDK
jgi:hypothetical protein